MLGSHRSGGTAENDGRTILVLYTDGGDTRSAIALGDVMTLVRASNATIYTVGFLEHQFGAFRFYGPYENPTVDWQPISIVPRPDLAMRLERPRTSNRNDPQPERF